MIHNELKSRGKFGHVSEIIEILDERKDIREINKKYHFGIGWNK